MSVRAADSLVAFHARNRWAVIRRRYLLWASSDGGKVAEWTIAALMAAGVVFGLIRFVVTAGE